MTQRSSATWRTPTLTCSCVFTPTQTMHKNKTQTHKYFQLVTLQTFRHPPPLAPSLCLSLPHKHTRVHAHAYTYTRTHTHFFLFPHTIWLMAHRTMNSAMSGMYSLTWALVCARVFVSERIWCQQGWFTLTYPPTTGIIPPASWRAHINTHTHTYTHTHARTHTKLIRSLHYCWIMLFSSRATGFSLWVQRS